MNRITTFSLTALAALLLGVGCDNPTAHVQDGGFGVDAGTRADAGPMSPTTQPQFGTPIVSSATRGVSQMVAADFNGDGTQDLVVSVGSQGQSFTGSSVVFLPGYGDGAFDSPVALDTGPTPQGLAVLDINGDGHPDFVVGVCADQANHLSFFVSSDGGFLPRVDVAVSACPYALAVADFNGDGRPDLATAAPGAGVTLTTATTGEVDIFYNLGGTFSDPVRLTTDAAALGIAAADLDGDGLPDLAVTTTAVLADGSANSKVLVWLGAHDGSLRALPSMSIARGGYRAMAAGDLDGDGHIDLALVSRSTSTLAIALGKGDGTFALPTYQDTSGGPAAIGLADFRQGGWLDAAVAESFIYPFLGLSVFPGGGKAPTPLGAELRLLSDGEARGLAIADFDGDGRPDVALSLTDLSSVAVIPALGGPPPLPDPATFTPAEHATLPLVPDQGGPIIDRPEVITLTFQDDPSGPSYQAYADWIVTSDWLATIGSPYGIGLGTNTNIVIHQNAPTAITDVGIQTLINQLILDGGVPSPTFGDGGMVPEQVYFVYFPNQTTISGQGLGMSCNNFGGYHSENSLGYTHFAYAVIPTCYPDFPSVQQTAVSHELAEACSDPLVGTHPAYTSTDFNEGLVGEIGDVCTSYSTSYALDGGAQMAVQRIWSNAAASQDQQPCIPAPAGPYANVSPDESVAVQKNIFQVGAGESLKVTITGWTNQSTVPFGVLAYPGGQGLTPSNFYPGVSISKQNLANGERASLTLSVPLGTPTGSIGAATLISGWNDDNFAYWPILVYVR